MSSEESIESEYLVLRNYKENGIAGRGFLIRILETALQQIENDTWIKTIPNNEKPQVRSLVQIDILSKIMMLIEDLAILAESFRQGRNFYDFLHDKTVDIGEMIETFFKSIDSMSKEELMIMLSYESPEKLGLNEQSYSILNRVVDSNLAEVRRILKEIGSFGKTNHPAFKRYKHAGFPIIVGSLPTSPTEELANFDSFSMVAVGKDPRKDVLPIPYSEDVLKGYWIVIDGIQKLLIDLTTNRMACIERKIPKLIPIEIYGEEPLSKEDRLKLDIIAKTFYDLHPLVYPPSRLNYSSELKREDLEWYLSLPTFLSECKARGERIAKRKMDEEESK
jgi:hypothetical protein